jgi:hypothetical protein
MEQFKRVLERFMPQDTGSEEGDAAEAADGGAAAAAAGAGGGDAAAAAVVSDADSDEEGEPHSCSWRHMLLQWDTCSAKVPERQQAVQQLLVGVARFYSGVHAM